MQEQKGKHLMSGKNYVVDSITLNVTVGTEGTSTSIKLNGYTIDDCGNIEHTAPICLKNPSCFADKVELIKDIYKIAKQKLDDQINSVTIDLHKTEISQIIQAYKQFQ